MSAVKPKGYRTKTDHKLRIACGFEDKLFKKILREAQKNKKPFSAMVEELCKVGLLDLEESDMLEPVQQPDALLQ